MISSSCDVMQAVMAIWSYFNYQIKMLTISTLSPINLCAWPIFDMAKFNIFKKVQLHSFPMIAILAYLIVMANPL